MQELSLEKDISNIHQMLHGRCLLDGNGSLERSNATWIKWQTFKNLLSIDVSHYLTLYPKFWRQFHPQGFLCSPSQYDERPWERGCLSTGCPFKTVLCLNGCCGETDCSTYIVFNCYVERTLP